MQCRSLRREARWEPVTPWRSGRKGEMVITARSVWQMHQSVRARETRRGMDLFQTPSRRQGREAACGAIANANGELILLTAAVLRLERATMATAIELRLHSCSQFSVFFNIFKRGGKGCPLASCWPTDLTERAHYTCSFASNTVFARVLLSIFHL